MNASNIQHALIALAVQIAVYVATGNALAGGAVAVAFFLGREVAQNEYRWIQSHGGLRSNMPTMAGFEEWSRDSALDAAVPALACTVFFFGARYFQPIMEMIREWTK